MSKSLREFINRSVTARSDDFGHDVHALMVWESHQLQIMGEKFEEHLNACETLQARVKELEGMLQDALLHLGPDWTGGWADAARKALAGKGIAP